MKEVKKNTPPSSPGDIKTSEWCWKREKETRKFFLLKLIIFNNLWVFNTVF